MSNQAKRASLSVIQGGGQTTPIWRRFPKEVFAKSPINSERAAIFRFAQHDITKAWERHRYQPILDGWALVIGRLPALPNIAKVSQELGHRQLVGIQSAHACFRGVRRPVGADSNGYDTVVYVTKPTLMLRHEPSLACIAQLESVPSDLLVAIYANLDQPREGRYGSPATKDIPVRGVITNWHFVECDPENDNLPINFKERYRKLQW